MKLGSVRLRLIAGPALLLASWAAPVRAQDDAGAGDAASEQTSEASTAPPTAEAATTPPAPRMSAGDITFVIEYPKWQPRATGPNIGFSLRYREDKLIPGEWLKTTVSDGGSYWLVTFPSRPEAGIVLRLEATYRFALGESSTARIKEEVAAAIDRVADLVAAALVEARTEKPDSDETDKDELKASIEKRSDEIERALQPLRRYWTKDDQNARAILLQRLGFLPEDSAKPDAAWTFQESKLTELAESQALTMLVDSAATLKKHRDSLTFKDAQGAGASTCKKRIGEHGEPDVDQAISILEACADAVIVAESKLKTGIEALVTRLKAFAGGTYKGSLELNVAFAEAIDKVPDFERAWTEEALSYSIQAVNAAAIQRHYLSTALKGGLLGVVDERWVLEESKPSDALLKIEAKRRWYDVSTGFVYVGGVRDVIVPTLLSICPKRCMKTDSGSSDYWGYRHNFSADFGVKAAILDKDQDERHKDTIGFLLGASYNPIDIVRISAGMYLFENGASEQRDWNVNGYAGITVNVLQAAELLGALGMAKVPKATIEIPETASK
jgi:hypothetical protein